MLLYVETAPLIYFIEEHPRYGEIVALMLAAVEAGEIRAITSTLTLLEVLTKPYAQAREDLASQYRDILTDTQRLTMVPIGEQVAERAARVRASKGLRTADAIHAATAIEGAADVLVTNDAVFERLDDVRVVVLDAVVGAADPASLLEEAMGIRRNGSSERE